MCANWRTSSLLASTPRHQSKFALMSGLCAARCRPYSRPRGYPGCVCRMGKCDTLSSSLFYHMHDSHISADVVCKLQHLHSHTMRTALRARLKKEASGGKPGRHHPAQAPTIDDATLSLQSTIIKIKDTTRHTILLLQCCLLYTSPSPRDLSTSRMPSSA